MPNPRFEPLTLSQEEWECFKLYVHEDVLRLVRECEAQAQRASQAEAALEEIRKEWRFIFYQCGACGVDRDVALSVDDRSIEDGAVICPKCYAELQRRRSPTGQEK